MIFKPKGDKSLRVIVAEMAAKGQPDDVLTFGALGYALGLDAATERDQIRQAVASARPVLLKDHSRALVSVRGEGYRIARAAEHAGIAQKHRVQADRQMTQALAVINHVNESEMTPGELQRHRATAIVINNVVRRMNDQEDRLSQLERDFYGTKPPVIQGIVIDP